MFAVLIEEYELYGSGKKSRESDYTLFSRLVVQHTKEQFLTKDRAAQLIKYARNGYFAHHRLLFRWMDFQKRQETAHSYIYVDTPAKLFNTKETPWTDLSKKEEEAKPQAG